MDSYLIAKDIMKDKPTILQDVKNAFNYSFLNGLKIICSMNVRKQIRLEKHFKKYDTNG